MYLQFSELVRDLFLNIEKRFVGPWIFALKTVHIVFIAVCYLRGIPPYLARRSVLAPSKPGTFLYLTPLNSYLANCNSYTVVCYLVFIYDGSSRG